MRSSNSPPILPSLFLAFRLVYIPASIFSHTGHGLPVINAALALAGSFGLEYLTRRSGQQTAPANRRRELWFVVLALLLLGLFPEEAPVSVILWAAIGGVWGRFWGHLWSETENKISPGSRIPSLFTRVSWPWTGWLAGALLGLSGLFGPGSWLMAGLLALWGRRDVREG